MTHSGIEAERLTPGKEKSVMTWAHRQNLAMHSSPENSLETYTIWEEAGFRPPISLILGIEMLHQIGMTEDAGGETTTALVSEILARLSWADMPQEKYIITDQAEMIRTANAYGIPVAERRPEEIARAITGEIVADYLPGRKTLEY